MMLPEFGRQEACPVLCVRRTVSLPWEGGFVRERGGRGGLICLYGTCGGTLLAGRTKRIVEQLREGVALKAQGRVFQLSF